MRRPARSLSMASMSVRYSRSVTGTPACFSSVKKVANIAAFLGRNRPRAGNVMRRLAAVERAAAAASVLRSSSRLLVAHAAEHALLEPRHAIDRSQERARHRKAQATIRHRLLHGVERGAHRPEAIVHHLGLVRMKHVEQRTRAKI